jgi:hypothetical protein
VVLPFEEGDDTTSPTPTDDDEFLLLIDCGDKPRTTSSETLSESGLPVNRDDRRCIFRNG